jgi:flavin reductase (DIM6/NTAB) family NADH-FMN oxidoreductase RutF
MSVARLVEAGDHTLVLGDVRAADVSTQAPLTYWQRTFGTHRAF